MSDDTRLRGAHHRDAMTCREVTERLRDFDHAERRAVESHLMVCDRCLRYLGEYELTLRLARAAEAAA
jgi:hypothetical protein